MTNEPVQIPVYHSLNREKMVEWRKVVIQARENWLAIQKEFGRDDRELAKFAKIEAADCLKHERACTQIIELIDGKRAGLGEWKGNEKGQLSWRVPKELEDAFRFCLGLAETS